LRAVLLGANEVSAGGTRLLSDVTESLHWSLDPCRYSRTSPHFFRSRIQTGSRSGSRPRFHVGGVIGQGR